jgi:hypothetical protein
LKESQIQIDVRLALGAEPDLVLWRNNIGVGEVRGSKIRFGVGGPGGADLIGLFRGRFVAIEIKTTVGRQTEEQQRFQQLVERKGGIYVVLRSADEARAWIDCLKHTEPM